MDRSEEFLMEFLLQKDKIALRLIGVICAILIIWSAIPANSAEVALFPLKELQVGMKGYGKTVISGRKIETGS